jgi:hypothetical protein
LAVSNVAETLILSLLTAIFKSPFLQLGTWMSREYSLESSLKSDARNL